VESLQNNNFAMRPLSAEVHSSNAGERLDAFLSNHFPFYSRNAWSRRIGEGRVRVNGRSVNKSYRIKIGDEFAHLAVAAEEPQIEEPVTILWQRGDLAAVNKPTGLPLHENGPFYLNTCIAHIRRLLGNDWSNLHRIDRDTSGIVLCGRGSRVRSIVQEQIASHQCTKIYTALVHGHFDRSIKKIDFALGEPGFEGLRSKRWIDPLGESALTVVESVEHSQTMSLLRLRIVSGRTHQIRVHCAALGHALVGDVLYHPDRTVYDHWQKDMNNERLAHLTGAKRLCLHAEEVHIPASDVAEAFSIRAETPEEILDVFRSN